MSGQGNKFLVRVRSAHQWRVHILPLLKTAGAAPGGRVLFSNVYDCYVGSDGFAFVKFDDKESARASGLPIIVARMHEHKDKLSKLKPIDRYKYPKLARVCKDNKEFTTLMGYKPTTAIEDIKCLPDLMYGVEQLLGRKTF
jgi:hypothetical protein